MSDNRRIILILLFLCLLSAIVSSCKSSKEPCDAYGSVTWDREVDSISVLKDNELYFPYTPVMQAREFHLNVSERGTYKVLLKDGDAIVETKSIVLK